jgi:hypothetical protein
MEGTQTTETCRPWETNRKSEGKRITVCQRVFFANHQAAAMASL